MCVCLVRRFAYLQDKKGGKSHYLESHYLSARQHFDILRRMEQVVYHSKNNNQQTILRACVFTGVALGTEHQVHFFQWWPLFILFAKILERAEMNNKGGKMGCEK